MYSGITVDGTLYDVRIVYGSIQRTFQIVEGTNTGTSIDATRIRDIIGTSYSYQMQIEPNPANMSDYYSFYNKISEPVDYHSIIMPYGNETLTFNACIEGGTDVDAGMFGGQRKWKTLTVVFTPLTPQTRPQ